MLSAEIPGSGHRKGPAQVHPMGHCFSCQPPGKHCGHRDVSIPSCKTQPPAPAVPCGCRVRVFREDFSFKDPVSCSAYWRIPKKAFHHEQRLRVPPCSTYHTPGRQLNLVSPVPWICRQCHGFLGGLTWSFCCFVSLSVH